MTAARPTAPVPLDEAIRQLDLPEAIADRRIRASKRAKELAGDARGQVIHSAGVLELDKALAPLRRQGWKPTDAETRAAEVEAGQGVDRLVAAQCEIHLRAEDMQAIYNDPDRLEHERNWQAYITQVSAYAFAQGNRSEVWVRQWREMVEERADTEQSGDPTGPIDRRLERHVGVPFPVAPAASWETVATISGLAEREAEVERLERKYPGTRPGTPVTDTPTKRRGGK
jgi:hypothetical protein